MKLQRYMYLDAPGIAGLYAQLHGHDVTETLLNTEHSRSSGLKLAIGKFLGFEGAGESSRSTREARSTKVSLRPENMLREISASLRAQGTLYTSLIEAIAATTSTHEPSWFEARHPFSVSPEIGKFNEMRLVMFSSGFPPHFDSPDAPRISMSASLHHFPTARDGQLSFSGHEAMFFRQINGKPHPYSIFGSIFSCDDQFQIKPFSILI